MEGQEERKERQGKETEIRKNSCLSVIDIAGLFVPESFKVRYVW